MKVKVEMKIKIYSRKNNKKNFYHSENKNVDKCGF